MDKQEFLNSKYLSLCQQLGDAEVKRHQLEDHISNLRAQIKSLNESFALMSEFELRSKVQKKAASEQV